MGSVNSTLAIRCVVTDVVLVMAISLVLCVAVPAGLAFAVALLSVGLHRLLALRTSTFPPAPPAPLASLAVGQLGALAVGTGSALYLVTWLSLAILNNLAGVGAIRGSEASLYKVFRAAVIAPVSEEMFFRAALVGVLLRGGWPRTAVAVGAFLFAIVHLRVRGFPALFISGIAYGVLYIRTGSVIWPIVAHSTHNVLALVFR